MVVGMAHTHLVAPADTSRIPSPIMESHQLRLLYSSLLPPAAPSVIQASAERLWSA